MTETPINLPSRKRDALWRGARGVCPKCGIGRLFRAYLKPVASCSDCAMNWEEVRADDGPAWATILIVGHLLAPLFHFLVFRVDLPDWAPALILASVGTLLCLLLLPRTKGAIMGLIWMTGAPTS